MTSAWPASASIAQAPSLFDLLDEALRDSERHDDSVGLLRAIARPLANALGKMRQEALAPFEQRLQYFARFLSSEIEDAGISTESPAYLLGRIDQLLDVCSVGIDRSLSEAVLQQAHRAHAFDILRHVARQPGITASALAEAVQVGQTHLSNILRWMEAAELIRRVESGRSSLVSLGPKGEAALAVLEAVGGDATTPQNQTPPAADPLEHDVRVLEREVATSVQDDLAAATQFSEVLLRTLAGNARDGLPLVGEGPTVALVQAAFAAASVGAQQTMRRAVVQTIAAWSPALHDAHSLELLADLAATLRLVEAALPLAAAMERALAVDQSPVTHDPSSAPTAVGRALAALAPSPDVEVGCLRLLARGVDRHLARHLFVALLRCAPDKCAMRIERFYDLIAPHDAWDPTSFAAMLLDGVSLELLLAELPRMSGEASHLVAAGLFGGPRPLAQVEADHRSVLVFDETGRPIRLVYHGIDRHRMNTLLSKYIGNAAATTEEIDRWLRGSADQSAANVHAGRHALGTFDWPRPEYAA